MAARTILHLIDTGGPGGAETVYLELVHHFDNARWRSIAVVPKRDWLYRALTERGIEPILVPTHGAFDARYLARLVQLARSQRAALIQTHLLTTAVYGSMVGRLLNVPVVSTFHGAVDVPDGRLTRLKGRIIDGRRRRAVFVSESLRHAVLPRLPLDESRTQIVHNGIDTAAFAGGRDGGLRRELGFRDDDVVIGAVGNVRVSKDYPNLLRAAAILRSRSTRYHVVIIGDTRSGTLIGELHRLRAELGLDEAVAFLGFRDDVAALLRGCDVFALSSDREGFSIATVQAMASGVPVVATRSGGPEEIVTHERDGLLVPPADPRALADALERVATDPLLVDRLTSSALCTARDRFSISTMTSMYEQIYDELLASASRSHGPV